MSLIDNILFVNPMPVIIHLTKYSLQILVILTLFSGVVQAGPLTKSEASPQAAIEQRDTTQRLDNTKLNNSTDAVQQPDGTTVSTTNSNEVETLQEEREPLTEKSPGVTAFLGNMLDGLSSLTLESETRFSSLAGNTPLIFHDLYKVFITL